jgi:TM2 domain-containing membrane protein YozV
MSDQAEYTLRWRGRSQGPYSLEEINHKLDEHEIGMGHEIQFEDRWVSLEEFFAALKPAAPSVRPAPGGTGASPAGPRPAGNATPVVRMTSAAPAAALQSQMTVAPPHMAPARAKRPRYRLLYALLAVCFGFSGLHNYYGRHWMTGLLQLLLSVATCLLGFGIIAPWLWALVEAMVVRRDGNGLEMI